MTRTAAVVVVAVLGGGMARALTSCGSDDAPGPPPEPAVTMGVEGDQVVLRNGVIEVSADLATGLWDVRAADGTRLLEGAETRVVTRLEGGEEAVLGTFGPGSRTFQTHTLDDALGKGLALEVEHSPRGGLRIISRVELRAEATWVTASANVHWADGAPPGTRVVSISPLVADARTAGALFVGPDPATHNVLDNGHDLYFDFVAQVYPVGSGGTLLFPPGTSSNWNIGVHDPVSGRGFVAGFLSSARGVGMLGLDFDPAVAAKDGGRKAFTRFDGVSHYMAPGRAPVREPGGEGLESEVLYVDFLPRSTHEGLEAFARHLAQRAGKRVWTEVPSGWNSWGGGAGSGGLGTNIDEALILANLAAAEEDFLPFGMTHFLIDDGWQVRKGDWRANPERFPDHDGVDGMKWLADRIREAGFVPGIWISPFEIDPGSELAKAHPDWWADVGPFGLSFVPDDILIPDLSRPDVLDFYADLFRRITQEWGYRWIKMDFSYFALFAADLSNPDPTASEVFHDALLRIREAIGLDTFFLMVSATGLSFDVADANRVTLDNEPWWGEPEAVGDQGIKATYKTLARRWYLGHNVWINHPDLIFFRDTHGLSFAEARAWASVVALTGGIVKLGETFLAMHEHPEWLDVARALIPVYPRSGRPLDVFDREYPETWDLQVEREGRKWHVVGLFNFGRNRDIRSVTWEDEAPRAVGVDLARIGLDPAARHLVFDAWELTWTWHTGARLERTVAPRTGEVLIVRPEPATPAVVATTRHILGGAVEVSGESFDPATGTLVATITAPAGHPVTVYAADSGLRLAAAAPGAPSQGDGLAWTTFTPTAPTTQVRFAFAAGNAGGQR